MVMKMVTVSDTKARLFIPTGSHVVPVELQTIPSDTGGGGGTTFDIFPIPPDEERAQGSVWLDSLTGIMYEQVNDDVTDPEWVVKYTIPSPGSGGTVIVQADTSAALASLFPTGTIVDGGLELPSGPNLLTPTIPRWAHNTAIRFDMTLIRGSAYDASFWLGTDDTHYYKFTWQGGDQNVVHYYNNGGGVFGAGPFDTAFGGSHVFGGKDSDPHTLRWEPLWSLQDQQFAGYVDNQGVIRLEDYSIVMAVLDTPLSVWVDAGGAGSILQSFRLTYVPG